MGILKAIGKGVWGVVSTIVTVGFGLPLSFLYWGLLSLLNIGKNRVNITECVQEVLKTYFTNIDLPKVKIVPNAWGIPPVFGIEAVTEGYTIFWKGNFSEKDNHDLRLLLHELVHVGQYEKWGRWSFSLLYVWNTINEVSYENNPLEKEANDYEKTVWEDDFPNKVKASCTDNGEPEVQQKPLEQLEWIWTLF